MTLISNSGLERVNFSAVVGDAIDLPLYVTNLDVPFPMVTARMQVRRKDGYLLKDWISGVSPADIVIDPFNIGYLHIFDIDGFDQSGFFDYDLECDNGAGVITMVKGIWHVEK
jgi:hypothetical protein